MSSLLILATKHLYYANFTSLIQIERMLLSFYIIYVKNLIPNKEFYIKKINFFIVNVKYQT